MLNRNRRRESRWWLMAWRIGGAALFVAAVAGFGQQAFAATQSGRKDPATLLQCDGQQFSVGEFLSTTETSTDTPQQIADRVIGQRRDELGSRAAVAQRTGVRDGPPSRRRAHGCRWRDEDGAFHGQRPAVRLEAGGHLCVRLTTGPGPTAFSRCVNAS
jgi:hypothetical protein